MKSKLKNQVRAVECLDPLPLSFSLLTIWNSL